MKILLLTMEDDFIFILFILFIIFDLIKEIIVFLRLISRKFIGSLINISYKNFSLL